MTTILTLVAVSVGSLAFRIVPLLCAARLPEGVIRTAGWAGTSVLAAITVRAVLHHQDGSVPAATLVAGVSVGVGLLLAVRGRSVVTVLLSAVGCYTALAVLLRAVA